VDATPPNIPDLSQCAREPIHVPGFVQPHGLFVAATEPDFTIIQVSANADRFCGLPAKSLLGRRLDTLLGDAAFAALRDVLASPDFGPAPLYVATTHPLAFEGPVNVVAHRSEGLLVVEPEPAAPGQTGSFQALYPLARTGLGRLEGAASTEDICQPAEEVRRLTGFDRVMV
jgi:light-regulated signal transduction histidine kinase (bacteriophytochrome)